jgi:hypothetical protein
MKKPPAEIVASALAVSTIFIGMLPWNLPPWAIFIAWAGTFAAGGPTRSIMRKLWITMPIGAVTAFLIVLGFRWAGSAFSGAAALLWQCAILFCLNGLMMSLGRIPAMGFVPGMFFGFACFFATLFGGFGPDPKNPVMALIACLAMNFLGPTYAWLTDRLAAHRGPVGTPVRDTTLA